MKRNPSTANHPNAGTNVEVPRDRVTDDKTAKKNMPAPDKVNIRDEDYTDGDKPLLPGSVEAKALHERPPPTKGELAVGTGGDAARPGKAGIHGKPIPPRQSLRRD